MPLPVETATFLKSSLADAGFEITVEPRSVNQHFEFVQAGKHELCLAGWSSDNLDPDNFLYPLLDPDNISDQGNNLSRYRSEDFHKLMLAGQEELIESERAVIYRKAQEIAFEDIPVIPLVHAEVWMARREFVRGFVMHPAALIRLRTVYFDVSLPQ